MKKGKYRFLFIQPFQLPKGGKHADKYHTPEVSKEQLLRMDYLNIRHLLEDVQMGYSRRSSSSLWGLGR